MDVTILGSGTSHGVPIIGCNCETCTSDNPKNNRFRSSIYIKTDVKNILIDTSPDLRLQLLNNEITDIDIVLFTHPHADHIMGFDDLRAINRINKSDIPCYGNKYTLDAIKKKFEYIFKDRHYRYSVPSVELNQITGDLTFNDLKVTPLPVKHNHDNVLGYKIGKLAYITDCSYIPEDTMEQLKEVDLLILDALRYKSHPKHFNINEAVDVIQSLDIKRAYLTHISHEIEHEKVNAELPEGIQLAFDGLQLKV